MSGANCAIVTAAAFGLAAICGVPRLLRVLTALVALVGFIVLVTPQPSVVRAGAMAVVVLVAIATARPGGGVAALSTAIIGLLAFDPWLARDYGSPSPQRRRRDSCSWPDRWPRGWPG